MAKSAANWRQQVEPHFGFLVQSGFDKVDVDDSSFWSLWVQYRSATAAIRVSKSNEFIRSEVHLIRLVDGEVPAYPIWIADERIDWTLLDTVMEARRPDLVDEATKQTGLTDSEVDQQVEFWARVLRDVAADFLQGDFAPLDEAAALTRSRVAENPQEVQVWIPSDAPDGAEIDHKAQTQRTVPPNVGVTVRRYRHGTAPDSDQS